MKKIKNKKTIIIVFIISFVLFINSVKAGPSGGVGGDSYVPGPVSGGGSGYSDTTIPQSRPIAYGFRVSIVDKSGKLAPKTHSIDYWSYWGWHNGDSYSGIQLGYTALTGSAKTPTAWSSNSWLYYEVPKPKTMGRGSDSTKKTEKLNSTYRKYMKESKYVDSNASEKYTVYLTSAGNANGGDKRIGNNYARIALDLFKNKVSKEDYKFFNIILKDCGVPGKDDNARTIYAKPYYLLVEPLTAIHTTLNVTKGSIALGTTNDLREMGVLGNYNDYVYHYFMYINPVVFNTYSNGPLNACTQSTQNDRRKIAGKGCVAAFTMYIGDIVKDNCSDNAKKIVNNYFTGGELKDGKSEQDYLKELYKDETVRKECKITKSGNKYYLNSTGNYCNALDPLSIKLFKGVTVANACSTVNCGNQVSALNSNYSNANTIESLANKLFKYWKDRNKEYTYLKRNIYDLLNGGVPKCDEANFHCDPVKGTIKNCSANMTLKDNANPGCWDKGVAYNMATDPSNASSYESSRDDYLSPYYGNKCDVYCIESVTFNLPQDKTEKAYGTKAGKVFKWGINTNVNDSLFGTMKVTRECKPIGLSCNKKSINPAYWVTVGTGNNNYINTLISLSYKESVANRVIDSANLKTSLVNIKINNKKVTSEKTVINTNSKFTVVANYRFDYDKELHWYSDKSQSSKSVPEKDIKVTLPNPHYVEIGYGLPTDFTEPSNVYSVKWTDDKGFDWDYIKKKTSGYMYATIKNIGTKNNDGSYHFDQLITDNTSAGFNKDGSLNYSCDFNIENELFEYECKDKDNDPIYCDHKQPGIDIVFRTIQLVNPTLSDKNSELVKAFPGRSGEGREIGKNWSMWKDGNPYDSTDKTNIYDILRNTIYDRKPLYKITLDSSTITKIREYNKKARNSKYKNKQVDPYTFMGEINNDDDSKKIGYSGYKCVKSDKSRFAYCASYFLTQLKQENKLTGECLINGDTNKRAFNFSTKICG